MSFITNLFKSKPIQPVGVERPVTLTDTLTPEAQDLRRRLLTDTAPNLLSTRQDTPEEATARRNLMDILNQQGQGDQSRAYRQLIADLDPIYRTENQRIAEGQRQRFIAEGVGSGTGRDEAIARDLRDAEQNRRANFSNLALQLGEAERNRGLSANELALNYGGERQRRNLADVVGAINILGTGERQATPGEVVTPGYRPSVASQLLSGAGQVAGAVTGLGNIFRRPKSTAPLDDYTNPYRNTASALRNKYPGLSLSQ